MGKSGKIWKNLGLPSEMFNPKHAFDVFMTHGTVFIDKCLPYNTIAILSGIVPKRIFHC